MFAHGASGGGPTSPQSAEPTKFGADARSLYLKAGTLDLRNVPSLLQPGTSFDPQTQYVIQLDGPITPARRSALLEVGVRLAAYLPRHAYVARLDGVSADAMMKLDFVVWVGRYEAAWKISPEIGRTNWASPERQQLQLTGKRRLIVTPFAAADALGIAPRAVRHGAVVRITGIEEGGGRLVLDVDPAEVERLAAMPEVLFIEEAGEMQPRNESTNWICQSNVSGSLPLWNAGLHGEGQIAGIIDWDLKQTHCSFNDPVNPIGPLHRKIVSYYGMGISPGYGYHGTHVGGTLAGYDLGETNPNLKGMAYEARFVFQHYSGVLVGGVLPVNDRLTIAHNDGARVHCNSWGDDGTTAYTASSRDIDVFTRNNEDDLVLVAVTNANAPVKTPENAKNCLAVAATSDTPSQEHRCYGGYGPTADGRQKPEVWAPGCGSYSADYYTSCGTHYGGGTSYATPAVAGMAVLVRQYLMSGYYPSGSPTPSDAFTPSGALLKAIVANAAVDMSGFPGYFTGAEGWGRILMSDALYFPGDARKLLVTEVRNSVGLSTGQTKSYWVSVNGAGQRLKFTLAWTDVPADLLASYTPVNDLDLLVTEPGGTTYHGNVFASGESATGGSADPLNNLEQVHRAAPATGVWRVDVTGTEVNEGLQGLALAITGDVAWYCVKGDVNHDGVINGEDIESFVRVLILGGDPWEECAADMNGAASPGTDDISSFVSLLLGS
jgi:hypothetical protein